MKAPFHVSPTAFQKPGKDPLPVSINQEQVVPVKGNFYVGILKNVLVKIVEGSEAGTFQKAIFWNFQVQIGIEGTVVAIVKEVVDLISEEENWRETNLGSDIKNRTEEKNSFGKKGVIFPDPLNIKVILGLGNFTKNSNL